MTIIAQSGPTRYVFTTTAVTAPAGRPFTIAFQNLDQQVLHSVDILKPDGSVVWQGEIFYGVASQVYQVAALKPGVYPFTCGIHPDMTGTLTVK